MGLQNALMGRIKRGPLMDHLRTHRRRRDDTQVIKMAMSSHIDFKQQNVIKSHFINSV